METMWRNSPILRSIFSGNEDGPRRDVDRCTIRLGDSWTIAVQWEMAPRLGDLEHILLSLTNSHQYLQIYMKQL